MQERADEGKGTAVTTVVSTVLGAVSLGIKLYLAFKGKKNAIAGLESENRNMESSWGGLGHFLYNSKIKENNIKIENLKK